MAALLAGTTHCAQCVTDSVRVYVYICVCNSAGFAWGYQRPFCAWMGLLQGSLLTRRETQQGVVLMLYSRTLAEKEIGGKMSLSSNSALSWGSFQYCHSNTVSWGYSSQILYRNIIIPPLTLPSSLIHTVHTVPTSSNITPRPQIFSYQYWHRQKGWEDNVSGHHLWHFYIIWVRQTVPYGWWG